VARLLSQCKSERNNGQKLKNCYALGSLRFWSCCWKLLGASLKQQTPLGRAGSELKQKGGTTYVSSRVRSAPDFIQEAANQITSQNRPVV
jgi:hypothetical protein